MQAVTETEIFRACQTLFGNDVRISRDFISYIQPSGVKSAYRKKAKETHPDLFTAVPPHIQQKQTDLFREILRAYDVLNLFFKQREQGLWKPSPASRPTARNDAQQEIRTKPRPAPSPSRQGTNNDTVSAVPFRVLQLGQYLFYRNKISFADLINALVWQRKRRPSVGSIASRWGWIDENGISSVSGSHIRPRLFGERAVALGLLSAFQVSTILSYQRSLQDRLGAYFVLNRILTAKQLDHLAQELKEHNNRVLSDKFTSRSPRNAHA